MSEVHNEQSFRYVRSAVVTDLVRGGLGAAMCLALAMIAGIGTPAFWLMLGLMLVFDIFVAITALKARSEVYLSDAGIGRRIAGIAVPGGLGSPLGLHEIAWSDVQTARLRFIGGRKRRSSDHLQLILKSSTRRLTIDADLDRFAYVAQKVLAQHEKLGKELDPATLGNLNAL